MDWKKHIHCTHRKRTCDDGQIRRARDGENRGKSEERKGKSGRENGRKEGKRGTGEGGRENEPIASSNLSLLGLGRENLYGLEIPC